MRHTRIAIATIFAVCAAPAFAQFGAMFQSVVENTAKGAVQQGRNSLGAGTKYDWCSRKRGTRPAGATTDQPSPFQWGWRCDG